jgi:hypothetical protein
VPSAAEGVAASRVDAYLARDVEALTLHTNARLTAVSLSKLQAVQTLGQLPVPFSMASIVRLCFNEFWRA